MHHRRIFEERLDAAVEAGRIDAEQAAEMLEQAEDKASDILNGDFAFEGRFGGSGERGFGGRGFGPGAAPDAAPDTDTAA